MKLARIRHRRRVWIAVQRDGAVSPIAEVVVAEVERLGMNRTPTVAGA
jgi:hypothetical protein